MKPFLLFALLAVAACAPQPSGLSPDDAFEAAQQAIRNRDAETAHALLAEAAKQDHLRSLALLTQSYGQSPAPGFAVPGEGAGSEPVLLPIEGGRARAVTTGLRFVRAINRGVRDGDPLALRYHATKLAFDEDPERRREAEQIYRDLLDSDLPASDLYHLAMVVGTDAERQRLTHLAAAEGDAQACAFSVWFYEDEPQSSWSHTAAIARYLDRLGACAPDRPIPSEAFGPIRDLRAQLDLGNPDSIIALDSLRQLGVFERHPELAAIVSR